MLANTQLIRTHFPMLSEPNLIDKIAEVGTLKKIPSGGELIRIGQYIKWIPLVIEGSVKIAREDQEGHEIFLYYLEGGNTCAMSLTCCLEEEKSSIKAVAEADTSMVMIPVRYMDEWMLQYRSWKNFVLRSYSTRFEELIRALDALAFQRMDQRLVKYLEERSKALKSDLLHVTHQEIAYDLNSSREAVSRLLKKLESQGEIKLGRNKIELLRKKV